jgi:hypothetical protein
MQIRYLTVAAAAILALGAATQAQALQITRAAGGGFTAGVAAVPMSGTDLVVDVSGVNTNAGAEDPSNVVRFYQLTPGALVDAMSWAVTITAFAPSWLSEATISFRNSDGDGVVLSPGAGVDQPGTGSYSDAVLLSDFALSFNIGADGLLRVEFFEGFDDPINPDALFVSGNVTFANVVPEPATYGMMALGLLAVGAAARHRRG